MIQLINSGAVKRNKVGNKKVNTHKASYYNVNDHRAQKKTYFFDFSTQKHS